MQLPENEGKKPSGAEPNSAQNAELSEAWRALLGLQATPAQAGETPIDPAAQVLPQASDPWNALLHARGMESVDLQKIHLRELHPSASDEDIEHALNMIQEAGNLPAPQEKKPGED